MDNKLEIIKGITIKKLDIDLKKGGDLIYYEGVLLAHYYNKNNPKENYFYDWSDTDNVVNRWMIYKITQKDLLLFLNKKLNALQLIQKNAYCYFVDIDKSGKHKQIIMCSIDTIPKDYLPKTDSYFGEDLYEEYALKLKSDLENKQVSDNKTNDFSSFKSARTKLEAKVKKILQQQTQEKNIKEVKQHLQKISTSVDFIEKKYVKKM